MSDRKEPTQPNLTAVVRCVNQVIANQNANCQLNWNIYMETQQRFARIHQEMAGLQRLLSEMSERQRSIFSSIRMMDNVLHGLGQRMSSSERREKELRAMVSHLVEFPPLHPNK
jgi:hypothetical protein